MTDLATKARTAVAWTAGLNILRDIVQFVQMLIVVRILPPEVYGQFGLTTTIFSFMVVFSAREFISHTVLERDEQAVNYQEQFTAGCVIQGTLFLIANAIAISFRWFPTYAPIQPLLHLTSFLFLVDLPSELRTRMLERQMNWRRLRSVEAIGILTGTALTIALALAGAGAYALVLPLFAMPLSFAVDLLLVERWHPTFAWHPERYRASRAFGMNRVASLSIVSGSNLLEGSILARSVGYAMLGLFGRAIGISTLFCQRLSTLLMSAVYPLLARIDPESGAYQRVGALLLRVVCWLTIPIAVGISFLRSDVVSVLYGNRWTSVIPFIPFAMVIGVLTAAVQPAYGLLLARQHARQCFYADVWRLVGMAAGLLLAVPFGIRVYLAALVLVHTVSLSMLLVSLMRTSAIRISGIAGAFAPALAASTVSLLAAESARAVALADVPPLVRLAVYIPVFAATYLLVLRMLFAPLLREVVGYLPRAGQVHRLLGFAEAV